VVIAVSPAPERFRRSALYAKRHRAATGGRVKFR
jgi:hypothetical protein